MDNPQTHRILKMTKSDFEVTYLSAFLAYCQRWSRSDKQLQKLLISQQLYNWWLPQAKEAEEYFVESAAPFIDKMDQTTAIDHYLKHMEATHQYYNKPILKKALANKYTSRN